MVPTYRTTVSSSIDSRGKYRFSLFLLTLQFDAACGLGVGALYKFSQLFGSAEMFQFFLARDCLAKCESDSHRQ
jgi:hypothetical protein